MFKRPVRIVAKQSHLEMSFDEIDSLESVRTNEYYG